MDGNQDLFYTELPAQHMALAEMLVSAKLFEPVPAGWSVIITDIKNSTVAVFEGRHQTVNLIATGSIVAVLNICYRMNILIPFFFGGDGATFIVPQAVVDEVMQALFIYREQTLANFGLELRTGIVPVKQVYAAAQEIRIAKYQSSTTLFIPVVLGNGLNHAEKLIKGDDAMLAGHPAPKMELDLTGMQCRWDRISPPKDSEEVVTLLVVAKDITRQADVLSSVISKLDLLYGPFPKRQPISIPGLKMNSTFNRLKLEMQVRLGRVRWLELAREWTVAIYGYIYFRTKDGKAYLNSLVEMADTLVIDGRINTVISGLASQRAQLHLFLDELESTGQLLYGLHSSSASVMSCYVRDLADGHVHFVDGSEGGYTQAARMLKTKLK